MTSITINGKILSILEKSYENKKTTYAQFLMESEAKGMEIIKVKIVKEEDILKLEKDTVVSIPVAIRGVFIILCHPRVVVKSYHKSSALSSLPSKWIAS